MHRTKATAILKNIIAPNFKFDLRTDVGDSFCSLLIDESSNIAVFKQLGICIIDFSMLKRKVVSTFLKLKLLEDDAQSIVKAIKNTLTEDKPSI